MALLDTKDEQEVWSKQHKDGDKDASPVSVGTGADGGASEEVELCDASTHLINGGGDGAPPPDSASSTVTTASADKLDSAPARPASPAGSRLSVYKLDYGVEVADSGCCKSKSKRILRKISCDFHAGLNAILGATGGGKSSLLDVLSGRINPTNLHGEVLLDGNQLPRNFKCTAGYVIQEDTVSSMLTVRENIAFSASLRLDSSVKEREQRVNEIIDQLELRKCADTRVGTALRRGISGGERKRTSIAMELINQPTVLFLDEPTTGLDSSTASSVMELLKTLADNGTTVIFSIHQPRYSIYKLFDTVTLLSCGDCLYQGASGDVLPYFETLGYVCEPHNNPSDFLLDVINGSEVCGSELPLVAVLESTVSVAKDDNVSIYISGDDQIDDVRNDKHKSLLSSWQRSQSFLRLENDLQQVYNDYAYKQNKEVTTSDETKYTTSFITQFMILSQRNWRTVWRNPHAFMTQIFTSFLLALIVGTIYFRISTDSLSAIQNRNGAFFFITMNFVFGNMAAVDIFIKERPLFVHETISGFYRMSAYFLSKLWFDVIPMRSIPILIFSLISYYMIGLNTVSAGKFFFFLFNVTMTSLAGTSIALTFSATCSEHTIGTLLTALIWTFMMIFSDLLVNISTIPIWLQPLQYLSIFKWSMNAALINELKDATYYPLNRTSHYLVLGNQYLENQRIEYQTAWHLWRNELALVVICVSFLSLTYLQLRKVNKRR